MADRETALAPGSRTSLRDVLAPPGDFELERALGTAYSLDAATLVAIPLFADGSDAIEQKTPLGVQRIFELGKRLTLLVQGDRIRVPPMVRNELLALVEDAVAVCSIPKASFHPKLLVLEYVDRATGAKHRRVVVSSRNLTVDDSWDFVVVMEEAESGGRPIPGLGDAIRGLAQFVTSDDAARRECRRVGDLLDALRFEPIQPFDSLSVRLLTPGSTAPTDVLATLTGEDLLVISPFVGVTQLKRLAQQAGARTRALVTRPVDVDDAIFNDFNVYQLREDLTDGDGGAGEQDREAAAEPLSETPDEPGRLRGLHAKMYFATNKDRTAVVLTSANATVSGWSRNVEIAVLGSVTPSRLKVSDLLRRRESFEDAPEFGDLLVPLSTDSTTDEPADPGWVKDVRDSLGSAEVRGILAEVDAQWTLKVEIRLHPAASSWPRGVTATTAPHSYPELATPLAATPDGTLKCSFNLPSGAQITRFLTVIVSHGLEAESVVLLMDLEGHRGWTADEARNQLVREMKPQFLRDLAWKVGAPLAEPPNGEVAQRGAGAAPGAGGVVNPPILERLLVNLHSPQAAAYVQTLDGMIGSVADDPEFEELVKTWALLRTVGR